MHGNHPRITVRGPFRGEQSPLPRTHTAHTPPEPRCTLTAGLAARNTPAATPRRVDWTTWWLWRGACTRSHPELGREIPQRPWYCVSRHGRVGRRQVFQSTPLHLGLNPRIPATTGAGWSSPVARQAHNLKAAGSNPAPATSILNA